MQHEAISSCPLPGCLREKANPYMASNSFLAVVESEKVPTETQQPRRWLHSPTHRPTGNAVSIALPSPAVPHPVCPVCPPFSLCSQSLMLSRALHISLRCTGDMASHVSLPHCQVLLDLSALSCISLTEKPLPRSLECFPPEVTVATGDVTICLPNSTPE